MSNEKPGELDSQVKDLLRTIRESGRPELQTLQPAEARATYMEGVRMLSGPQVAVAKIAEAACESDVGPIPIRLYYPPRDDGLPLPLVVYFHGGGWCFGSIESHDSVCRTLCAGAGCIVASVEYHLAPEHKFPQAVNDAVAASSWAVENAAAIGADQARIVLAGDSAGANLAAVAALAARDTGQHEFLCQLLVYPATDQTMSFPSHNMFGDGYRLTRPLMVWSSINYLRDGHDVLDPRASPLFASDHSGLPPAIIVTAGFDPLRDEGEAYARKLSAAGVEVQYKCYERLIHGFIGLAGVVESAAAALDEIAGMLERKF